MPGRHTTCVYCIADLEIAHLAMTPESILYAVNTKTKGKVHLVKRGGVSFPRAKIQVACGWHITQSVSSIFNCRRVRWGDYCCRCFLPQGIPSGATNNNEAEAIEDFADAEKAK